MFTERLKSFKQIMGLNKSYSKWAGSAKYEIVRYNEVKFVITG